MKIIGFLFFLIFNLITTIDVLCQSVSCKKSKVTIKRYQVNNIPLSEIDSFLSKSEPFEVKIDSFFNNRKINTALLYAGRVTGYKFYTYNSKGNLLKIVNGMLGSNFKGDSIVYTYDHSGRILSVANSDGIDEDHLYSVGYSYKNGKTYLTDYYNGITAVTTVFWRDKKKNYQYSKVIGSTNDVDYYLKKYDKHGHVTSEENCLNNKCTVALSYILKYNDCGDLTRELLVGSDNKIFSAVTFDIE